MSTIRSGGLPGFSLAAFRPKMKGRKREMSRFLELIRLSMKGDGSGCSEAIDFEIGRCGKLMIERGNCFDGGEKLKILVFLR